MIVEIKIEDEKQMKWLRLFTLKIKNSNYKSVQSHNSQADVEIDLLIIRSREISIVAVDV